MLDTHLRSLVNTVKPDFGKSQTAASHVKRHDFAEALLYTTGLGPSTEGAQRAFNYSSRVGEIYKRPARGIYVPLNASRDLNTASAPTGGDLVANTYAASLIEAIRPASVAIQAGARLIPGVPDGAVILPKLDSASTVHWINEGSSPPQGDPEFAPSILINPRTISGRTKYTRRLMGMSALAASFERAIFDDLFRSIWTEVDRVVLCGSGVAPEPMGILNNGNFHVEEIGTDGGAPTWGLLTEIERELGSRLGYSDASWVTNAAVRKKLRNTRRAADLDFCWSDTNEVLGRSTFVTEHIPSNLEKGTSDTLSAIAFGDFSTIIMPIWGPAAIDVIVNPYTYANSGMVEMMAFMDIGIGFRHDEAFVVCKDVDPTL